MKRRICEQCEQKLPADYISAEVNVTIWDRSLGGNDHKLCVLDWCNEQCRLTWLEEHIP